MSGRQRAPAGLMIVYEPTSTSRTDVDIVFIHGIQGSYEQTWGSPSFSWPDELPREFPNARILAWNYEFILRNDFSNSITSLAEMLIQDLINARDQYAAYQRPIIFIAYSMGGLIVKTALKMSEHAPPSIRPDVSSIIQLTRGICFFGTPQAGPNREAWLQVVSAVKRAAISSSLDFARIARLLTDSLENDALRDVSEAFRGVVNRNSTQILTFFERKPTPTNRGSQMVVNKNAAIIGTINEECVARNADHIGISKFSSRHEHDYRKLTEFLRGLIPQASNENMPEPPAQNTETYHSEPTTLLQTEIQLPEKEDRFLELLRLDWLEEDVISDPHPGTCDWFLRCVEWVIWRSIKQKPILDQDRRLHILGTPGMGKTVLAKFLANSLRHNPESSSAWSPRIVLSYFFDQSAEPRWTFSGFVRRLLHQLLSYDRLHGRLFKYLYGKPLFENGQLTHRSAYDTLEILLQEQSLGEIAIVIDAFDECKEQHNLKDFFTFLQGQEHIRTIITARSGEFALPGPNYLCVDLDLVTLPGSDDPNRKRVKTCVSEYVKAEVTGVSQRRRLSEAFQRQFQDCIMQHEPPNFLWVRLAVRYVEIQKTPWLSRSVMKDLPPSISGLLKNYVGTTNGYDKKIIVNSLYIVMLAKAPITVDSLSFLIAATLNTHLFFTQKLASTLSLTTFTENTLQDFEMEVQSLPLLKITRGTVTLMHSSIKRTLEDSNELGMIYGEDENCPHLHERSLYEVLPKGFSQEVQHAMAELSLAYLIAAIEQKHDPLNFLNYAVLFWPDHIRESAKQKSELPSTLMSLVDRFLDNEVVFKKWCQAYAELDTSKKRTELPQQNGLSKPNRLAFTLAAFDLCHVLGDAFLPDLSSHLLSRDQLGRTPLELAVKNNSLHSIKWMQEVKQPQGQTLHAMAVAGGKLEKSPIYLAIQHGTVEMVDVLLNSPSTTADDIEPNMHKIAAEYGRQDIFLRLYERNLVPISSMDDALSALDSAVTLNSWKVAEKINLPEGINVSVRNNLLHKAIRSGATEIVDRLLQDKDVIELADDHGRLPLHTAAETGNDIILESLLRHGARVNVLDNRFQTPLHLASKAGWLRCCSMLLNKPENGARLNLSDRNGRIPAHYAAEFGHSDLLKTLLDAGSNIFASDKNGQTQLHLAAAKGQAATVEILLEKGADVNAQNAQGRTALHEAIKSGNVGILCLLRDSGAEIAAKDDEGATPLHLAAKGQSPILVRKLIEFGADPNSQDIARNTPMYYCLRARKPSEEVFKALKEKGALLESHMLDQLPAKSRARGWLKPSKIKKPSLLSDQFLSIDGSLGGNEETGYPVDKALPPTLDAEEGLVETSENPDEDDTAFVRTPKGEE